MTAFATITINDGAATPVARTFTARRIDDGVAKWQEITGGIAVGFPTITASLREPLRNQKNGARVYRGTLKVVYPVLEVVNASTYNGITPAPTKAYDCTMNVDFTFPERSTQQDRKHIRALMANALAQADLKALIEDLNMVF